MILSSRLIALESDECCCDKDDDPDEFSDRGLMPRRVSAPRGLAEPFPCLIEQVHAAPG